MTPAELDPDFQWILSERPHLRRVAMSLTRCHDADADDLVQETVYRALRAHQRLRPGSCTRAWLCTILRHRFLTIAEERTRRRVRSWTDAGVTESHAEGVLPAARNVPDASASVSAEDQLACVEERLSDAVRRAVRCVPAVYRDPFLLHALAGLKYREIAQKLGVPRGTVMSRIHRAKTRMRCTLRGSEFRLAGGVR